jgi:hypothetical protein
MRPSSPDPSRPIRLAGTVCLALAAACTTRTLEERSSFDLDALPPRAPSQVAPQILEARGVALERSIELVPLGFVAADAATPPLVSPDGRTIAVQLAPTPAWNDLLGWSPSMPSPPPAVAIVRIGEEGRLGEPQVLREPLLLGRCGGGSGFLVESPRGDGSRWIGEVAWEDGTIEWLLAEAAVASMAWRDDEGRLAWCHSERAGDPASLRFSGREGGVREWPPPPGATWLAPAFTGDRRHLVGILQRDGRSSLVAIDLEDEQASPQSLELSIRVNAPQSLAASWALGENVSLSGEPGLYVLHPDWRTLARWNPSEGRLDRFPPRTFSWSHSIAGGRILGDADALWFVPDGDESGAARELEAGVLLEGRWLVRVVEASGRPDAHDDGAAIVIGAIEGGFDVARLRLSTPADGEPDS